MDPSADVPHRRRPYSLLFPSNLIHNGAMEIFRLFRQPSNNSDAILIDRIRPSSTAEDGELSIRIIRSEDMDLARIPDDNSVSSSTNLSAPAPAPAPAASSSSSSSVSIAPSSSSSSSSPAVVSLLPVTVSEASRNDSSSQAETAEPEPVMNQRYDLQLIGRWMEQILPFCLLLLTVFIRQHLQGFLLTLWLSYAMMKSNEFLKKQTALKGERKSVFIGIGGGLLLMQIIAVYWWCTKDLLRSLIMLPPKEVPEFWHAIFIILMNDILVRQGAMVLKSWLLIYYKNRRGRNYRLQGQLLTLIEYFILLYRALLPTPVWYRFFLNKDYGSFFSSLTTGLYLTFKLTYLLEKVNLFIAAVKALSRKEMQYGSYATAEEVTAAGDICAICQEKMHAPILLSCKHMFCEDCVSEWLERERTCPLCRAFVKPADLKSFGDGSTSLFYQMF